MHKYVFVVFALSAITAKCQVQSYSIMKDRNVSGQLDSLFLEYTSLNLFQGTVLVKQNNRIVYSNSFGFADHERKIRNSKKHRYNAGSITKAFTAVLVMQLVERGKISLDDTLKRILPGIRFYNADKITIRQLLSHTSGLGNYIGPPVVKERKNIHSIDDVIPFILNLPANFNQPPGDFRYSSTNYIILGKVLEKILDKNYIDILSERILVPLSMTRTGSFCLEKDSTLNSKGYRLTSLNKLIQNNEVNTCEFFSDGGIYTTADDLISFWSALFDRKLLKDNTIKLMLTESREGSAYGLGIELNNYFEGITYGHNGSTPFFKADYRYYPQDDLDVAFLANSSAFNSRQLSKNIYAILKGHEVEHPVLPLGNYLTSILDTKGLSFLKSNFKQLLAKNDYKIETHNSLNNYGYDLLGAERIQEAIAIFSINADLFPTVPNVYDSLGEAYLENGDRDNARLYYQKVLELDPGNVNAKESLEKLANR